MAEVGDSRLENVVEYQIFDSRCFYKDKDSCDIQGTLCEILSYSQSLIEDYIWQNDSFNLRAHEQLVKSNDGGESIPCLQGSTNFGDNIEDEWFIVYILFSISKRFPNLVARVNDNDGEFLLIEAADYLPKWLEPDTSENRVFLYQGKLHIIPLPRKPSEITVFPAGKPTICQALKILESNSEKTIALPWIQDPVQRKVEEYPNKSSSFHHVLCYLPSPLKYLLERKPSLIAPAILAFVNCDPIDGKACRKMTQFGFESPVPHRVCFTRCLYGQLVKQNFTPDRSASKMLPEVSSSAYKGHILGLQLTYGFEILYAQQRATSNGVPTPTSAEGHQWEKYLDALHRHGYFKDELLGSKLYCQLMEKAKEYFSRNCLNNDGNCNVTEIEVLLQDMPPNSDETSTEVGNEILPDDDDDDESWLVISPEELESILSKYGCEGKLSSSDLDLNNVVHGINSFVETVSDYKGAEFPSEVSDEVEIQFDPDDFIKSMDSLFLKPGKHGNEEDSSEDESGDDSTAEDEEYNKYANSMDKELSVTHVGESFVKMKESNDCVKENGTEHPSTLPDEKTDEGEMKPVDIDLNLVQNFLESFSLQEGIPGPVSNILNSMGIPLPQSLAESD